MLEGSKMIELIVVSASGGSIVTTLIYCAVSYFINNRLNKADKKVELAPVSSSKPKVESLSNSKFYPYSQFVHILNKIRNGNSPVTHYADRIYKILNKKDTSYYSLIEAINLYNRSLIYSCSISDFEPNIRIIKSFGIIENVIIYEIRVSHKDSTIDFIIGSNGENVDFVAEDYEEYKKIKNKVDELKKSLTDYESVNSPDQEIIQSVKEKIDEGEERLQLTVNKIKMVVDDSKNKAEIEKGFDLYNKSMSTVF